LLQINSILLMLWSKREQLHCNPRKVLNLLCLEMRLNNIYKGILFWSTTISPTIILHPYISTHPGFSSHNTQGHHHSNLSEIERNKRAIAAPPTLLIADLFTLSVIVSKLPREEQKSHSRTCYSANRRLVRIPIIRRVFTQTFVSLRDISSTIFATQYPLLDTHKFSHSIL